MNYEEITLVEKVVVGISAKTGNSDPMMQKVIGGLWQKFYQMGISDSVKNKINGYAIGLYSDYEAESYLVTVGNEVSKADNPELSVKIIPAGSYAKFVVKGNMITAVAAAWNEIWQMNLNRSFTGDYEEYLDGDMENAEINIYVALK